MTDKTLANICAKHGFPEAVVDAMKKIPTVYVNELTGRNEISMAGKAALNERDYSSNVLSWCLGGFLDVPADVVANPYSQMLQTVLECDFDSVRIGVLNAAASAVAGVKVAVSASSTLGSNTGSMGLDPATGQAYGSLFTFVAQTLTLTAAPADSTGGTGVNIGGSNCSVTWTPWLSNAPSVPRADGTSELPAINVIVTWPVGGKRTFIAGSVLQAATNLGDEVLALNRPVRSMIASAKDASVNPAWMIASNGGCVRSTTEYAPIIIQYVPRNGKGRTLVVYGDSIHGGSGSSTMYQGWAREWQDSVSNKSNPISICQLAVAGSGQAGWTDRISATLGSMGKCVAFVPSLSPNNLSSPITASNIKVARYKWADQRRLVDAQNARLITSTVIPSNYSVKQYGTSDVTYRVAWNNELLTTYFEVVDFDFVASSETVDVNGQYSMVSSADGIHPDTPLYKLMAGAFGLVW